MGILLLLVPISLILLGIAVWALVWAVRSGQYDDLDTPAIDVLRQDRPLESETTRKSAPEPDTNAD